MGKIIRNEKIITPTQYIEKENMEFANHLILRDIEELIIPDGIDYIAPYAFYSWTAITNTPSNYKTLRKVIIPNSVTTIEYMAFSRCQQLTEVTLGNNLTEINISAFESNGSLTTINNFLTNKLTKIQGRAFASCNKLELSALPSQLTVLENYAFSRCFKITIREIPVGINNISNNVFQTCTSLAQMNFNGNIKIINYQAFDGCTNLTKFTFPNNTAVPTLSNINAIPNGANYTGQIAIPNSLYDTWTTATNWVSLTTAQWIRFIDSWDETITVEGDYALKTDTDLTDVRHLTPAS